MNEMKCINKTDFPFLKLTVYGHKLRYLDTASTSQKPQQVIDALVDFYTQHNANIGRSVYSLAEQATTLYEQARAKVAAYINADTQEVIFTSGCTESINYVASVWAMKKLKPGDEIVLTELEHHANILPWQQVAKQTGASLRYIPINVDGTLDITHLDSIITSATRLVSFSLVSNAIGTCIDPHPLVKRVRAVGAYVMIDAAQAVLHEKVDVKALDCDFLSFSGHKMLGPTGIGVLYIKKNIQSQVEPYQLGGGMVSHVSLDSATYISSVSRFEAGTPPIAQAIGLAAAIQYLQTIDRKQLKKYEAALCAQLIEGLKKLPSVKILGSIDQLTQQGHLVSFTVKGVHPHDVAAFLANQGICVRAGTQCAQPLFLKLGLSQGCIRVSFFAYNIPEDVDFLLKTLQDLSKSYPSRI